MNSVIILVIFAEFSLNMPCRPPQRATRMIRSDNRNQTGESGYKTGMEWFHKNHKKSLKYRLLNTDNKVFTNISDLITYKFICDNCHVGHVTSYCIILSRKIIHFWHTPVVSLFATRLFATRFREICVLIIKMTKKRFNMMT